MSTSGIRGEVLARSTPTRWNAILSLGARRKLDLYAPLRRKRNVRSAYVSMQGQKDSCEIPAGTRSFRELEYPLYFPSCPRSA